MICDQCGQEAAELQRTRSSFSSGSDHLEIEAVPVVQCQRCGEEYFTAQTARRLARIQRDWMEQEAGRRASVLHFDGAA